MINLVGLILVLLNWFEAPKTPGKQKEDVYTIHTGIAGQCDNPGCLQVMPSKTFN